MIQKNTPLIIGLLTLALLTLSPRVLHAQQRVSENFVFINYIGQEITLDLDDVTYVVPGTNASMDGGRLALNLPPGQHKYAASVPGVPLGSAGEFTLAVAQVVVKGAHIQKTPPTIDHRGIVLLEPQDQVLVFDIDPFAAPAEDPASLDTWQPTAAASSQGSIVWINHWGNDPLTLDLNGVQHTVPAANGNVPGRLQLDLAPGLYRYTTSVPYGSLNDEVMVQVGEVIGLNIYADPLPEPVFEVGEKSPLPLPVTLRLNQEMLTSQVSQAQMMNTSPADTPPLTLPNTGGVLEPLIEPLPTQPGLLIKNFTADDLIFTINDQTYIIAPNAEQILPILAGQYSYTASLPFAATTGIVDLGTDNTVELSIVLSLTNDVLTVYQN